MYKENLVDSTRSELYAYDGLNQLTAFDRGTLNASSVRIAELFREAIRENAASLIIVHNHPSGDPAPSPEDVRITADAVNAGRLLDIEVLDHLVVGRPGPDREGYVSLKERRLGFD